MPVKKISVFPLALGKSTPMLPYLSLGMVSAYVKVHDDGALNEFYNFEPLIPAGHEQGSIYVAKRALAGAILPIVLLSSYVWNHGLNIRTARDIRKQKPRAVIVIGGPHVPKYEGETEDFLRENPFIDIAVLGEGEATMAEILTALAGKNWPRDALADLADVPGIVYAAKRGDKTEIVRTESRQRLKDINVLPSPYLTGEFEPWFRNFAAAILETNRGCPYGCTYCDWGSATLARVTRFTTERVVAEIEHIARRNSESIFIADANFGMLEQDIEVAHALVNAREKYGYPQRLFSNFAKNGGRRLMETIKILHEGGLLPTGIIALQTTDPDVLEAIERDNIKTSAYEKMMTYFNQENIPMASDLMIGLPGQTVDSFAQDLQFCFNWKVSAAANYTSLMPNAPMAEKSYREKFGIVAGEQDIIESTNSFTGADMVYMKRLFTAYQFHVRFAIGKYLLYYLQLEHGIEAIQFLRRWLAALDAQEEGLPISNRIVAEIFETGSHHGNWAIMTWTNNADFLFSDLGSYCVELLEFAQRAYGITIEGGDIATLQATQAAVIPSLGRRYPYELSLDHDIVGYIKQIKAVPSVAHFDADYQPLSRFPPGSLRVEADEEVLTSTAYAISVHHNDEWELASPLRFH